MRMYRREQTFPDGTKRVWGPWWVQFYVGHKLIRKSLRTRDKRAAEIAAGELIRKAELRAAGVFDPHEEEKTRGIDEHLDEFQSVLLARDVVAQYRKERLSMLRAFVEWAKVKNLGDLDVADASRWISDLAATNLSARSLNSRITALKQLGIWLFKTHRLPFDPFSTMQKRNEAADRRHVRRALTQEDVGLLLDATRRRPLEAARRRRVSTPLTAKEEAHLHELGACRSLVYLIAVSTGLRRGEIKRLTWGDIDFDRGQARVTARSAKSRREQTVELNGRVLAALKAARPTTAMPCATVVPARRFPNMITFEKDLEAAGIERVDESDRIVDFHSLRHTFISSLAVAGVHPRVAMALARHSDISLTMKHYTDVSLLDLKGAVEKIGAAQPARSARTA